MDDLIFTTKNMLLHHGIEGQKWGVRHGPPYPLSRVDHNKVTKKTDNFISKRNAYASGWHTKYDSKSGSIQAELQDISPDVPLFGENDTKVTQDLKDVILDDHYYGGIPVVNINNKLHTTAELLDEPFWPKTYKAKNLDDALNRLDVNNPDYYASNKRNNCASCSTAYILKLMGYEDVMARPAAIGVPQGLVGTIFNGAKNLVPETNGEIDINELDKRLKKLPDKSFGYLGISGENMGHAMNYFKDGDELFYLDGQTNDVYTSLQELQNDCPTEITTGIAYDCTNATPNLKKIGQYGFIMDARKLTKNDIYDENEGIGQELTRTQTSDVSLGYGLQYDADKKRFKEETQWQLWHI